MSIDRRRPNPAWRRSSFLPFLASQLVDMIDRRFEPQLIIDVCCGRGSCSLAMAERFPGAKVVAVDVNREQIDRARAGTTTMEDGQIEVLCHDLRMPWPFDTKSASLIVGTGALSNLDDQAFAFSEMKRVLQPEGLIAFGDYLIPAHVQETWGVLSAIRYGSRRPYLDYSKLQDLMFDAGFEFESYRPIRWLNTITETIQDFDEITRNLYTKGILAITDESVKASLRLAGDGTSTDPITVIHDAFAMVGVASVGQPSGTFGMA